MKLYIIVRESNKKPLEFLKNSRVPKYYKTITEAQNNADIHNAAINYISNFIVMEKEAYDNITLEPRPSVTAEGREP